MVKRKEGIFGTFDIPLLIAFLLLMFMGWFNIYSAGLSLDHPSIFDSSREYGKQFYWMMGALFIGFVILLLDGEVFKQFSIPFYGFTVLLLIAVLFFGKKVNGATSWFGFGSFGIQPSEFAKLGVALALSGFLVQVNEKIPTKRTKLKAMAIIAIPALLVLMQPDAGTTLVFASAVLVLYREGLSGNLLLLALLAIVIAILSMLTMNYSLELFSFSIPGYAVLCFVIAMVCVAGYFLIKYFIVPRHRKKYFRNIIVTGGISLILIASVSYVYNNEGLLPEHMKNRLNVLFGHTQDIQGVGYNVHQSKIAIGSGGSTGKGYLDGTLTKYKYVPMQSTDFIFCTIGEEWGFLGSSFVVLLFLFLFYRIIHIAERQRSRFTRIYAYAIASILFFHFMINVGMTIGLAPVIGIPLPFFSYGGSSLIVFSAMLFILLKLDSERLEVLR
ncbi:MAG: rod shape-determining protein RodA [Flavobacteriales bacterium]|nr:rod shape-determining protein RodA [Flavobacteriales bacterium]